MPGRAIICSLELTIHCVKSPGTVLPTKGDIYVGVTLFGRRERTLFCDPHFPLCFHERLVFERLYGHVKDPVHVLEKLVDETITIELIQSSGVSERDYLLAETKSDLRSFFFPSLSFSPTLTQNREILMEKSPLFAGTPPLLEFTTYTAVEDLTPSVPQVEFDLAPKLVSTGRRKPRAKSRSRARGSSKRSPTGKRRSAMVRSSSTSGLNSRSSLYDAANNFAHNTANYTRQTVTSALHQHAKRGDHVKRMIAAHAIHSDVLGHLHQLAAPDCSLCKPIPGDDACSIKLNRWCMDDDPDRKAKANDENRYKDSITPRVDERPVERPPFLVRHFNDWTPSSRWPGLPDKLKVDGRKSPTRAGPIKATHGNFETLGSGRVSRVSDSDYKGDFKHRSYSYADGDDLNSNSEYSSRYPDDRASSRLSCADAYEPASGRLSRRSASTSGLYDFESSASNADLTRPRRPSRTRDVPSLNISHRTSSIADLLDTQNSSDAISERVRRALLRDSAHEKQLVHLISKYDDERRSRGSLEKLEVDLLRSNR